MPVLIRPAGPGDAPALRRMNIAFNGDTAVSEQNIRSALTAGAEIVLIAESDGTPAGFCCAQVHRSFCYPAPVAEVTEMYVAPPFRRRGCASAMLRCLEEQLQDGHGVDEIHLLTGSGNSAAQAAYEKAGFARKNEVYMTKEVRAKR